MDRCDPCGGHTPGSPGSAGVPDVVGLPLAEALGQLQGLECTLAYTAPPRPKGRAGTVRVVGQRLEGGRLKLICAREYHEAAAGSGGEPGEDGGEEDHG